MSLRILSALALAAAGFALAVAGCGSDESASPTTTSQAPTTTTTPTPTAATMTTTTTAKPKPKPALKSFTIVVEQAQPKGGIKTYTVKKGERVTLVVRSDVQDSVHLHGYDIERPLVNGKARIALTATVPGRFDFELEDRGVLLGRLQVEP